MDKKVFIALAIVAVMAFAASAAFAADITAATMIGSVSFAPSTAVTVNTISKNNTDASNPNTYCVESWHASSLGQSGGKEFGALYNQAIIMSRDLSSPGTTPTRCADSFTALASPWQ